LQSRAVDRRLQRRVQSGHSDNEKPRGTHGASPQDFRSNVSPIREGGCTARFCVSDTRCGTYLIYLHTCKANTQLAPIQQTHGLGVAYAEAYCFRIFWPTGGLRIVHSVGFVGFLAWLFRKLRAVNAALRTTSTSCGTARLHSLRRNSALQGVGALAPTSRAWLFVGFSP
jgi:hypothetical protein